MKIIGITGGTGAGKSAVCAELEKYGALVVDCDKIARQVVRKGEPALKEIVASFGEGILTSEGELDRRKMGSIVFSDSEKLRCLNEITHKHIFEQMRKMLGEATEEFAVLDVPLLFQCDFPIECDFTVAVTAPDDVRIKRITLRDGIDKDAAVARMSKQLSDEEYRMRADVCFENTGDEKRIKKFAKELFERVKEN